MDGCEDVPVLEAVLRKYRAWEALTPMQGIDELDGHTL